MNLAHSTPVVRFGRNGGAAGMHFAVAKIGVNRLELEIVRCVLAPPERVCLEIMS